jgi:predicted MarR family transcription regulator
MSALGRCKAAMRAVIEHYGYCSVRCVAWKWRRDVAGPYNPLPGIKHKDCPKSLADRCPIRDCL